MSKEHKKLAERKHKMVHDFLVKAFQDCEVEYNGVEGIDHKIIYNGKTTIIETKTCAKIIKSGTKLPLDGQPLLLQKVRLGRIKFNTKPEYPYNESQHVDLVRSNGWYIFVIGNTQYTLAGIPASEISHILERWVDLPSWDKILALCYPTKTMKALLADPTNTWLEKLKVQVYEKK